ncbi:head GIN domain-containing protein [Nafulsella turpanensis]|uniref:head GIN domain-containing protein n=1 Tax=Nafulsella turpanensis TaxID=1265690 RepID=UPI00135F15D9|nr:head GIN domain-containing protein [Nafulsella turpanensis]
MKKGLLTAISGVFLLLPACDKGIHETGNGTITSEIRNVGPFSALEVEGEYEIVLQEGTNPRVAIETDENLHKYIEAVVEGNTLTIKNVEEIEASEGTKLLITYLDLHEVKIGGAAKIFNEGMLETDELRIVVEGAGLLDLGLQVNELNLRLGGAGSINLYGEAEEQRLELSGAGSLDALELESERCEIYLSGFGSAGVFVTESLEAEVSGVGGIRVKGDPENISSEITGLGGVTRIKEN